MKYTTFIINKQTLNQGLSRRVKQINRYDTKRYIFKLKREYIVYIVRKRMNGNLTNVIKNKIKQSIKNKFNWANEENHMSRHLKLCIYPRHWWWF